MKKSIILLSAALMLLFTSVSAQSKTEIAQERQAITKMSEKELNKKASDAARKEAKKLKKEGWIVAPGALPIEKQLDRAFLMQYETDANMYPTYIMGVAMSIGESYDAAKMQALELAKQDIAGQIQTELTALVDNTVANKQLSRERAASITESIMASKNLISARLGRVVPIVEVYREIRNRNKEVLLRCFYNSSAAMDSARDVIRENLEQKGIELHQELDERLK